MIEDGVGFVADVLISVICPVHNAERYVADCVASCAGQTLGDLELIFVDDGSTDGSLGLLRKLAKDEPRLIVLPQENAGAAEARNRGLSAARGEFVFFIDSDDYIPNPEALERLYDAAKRHRVEIAGGSLCVDRNGTLEFDSLHGKELDSFFREEVVEYADYQYDYDYTRYIYSLGLIRRENLSFPSREQFEDPPFFVRAMLAAGRFATVPVTVYAYRYGHQNRTLSEKALLDRLEGIIELLELSSELRYAKLHLHVLRQLEGESTYAFLSNARNGRVMNRLMEANVAVDRALLREIGSSIDDDYVVEPLSMMFGGFAKCFRLVDLPPARALTRVLRAARRGKDA